ncbi:MAG: hydantoinase/oxoprolinase family protein [Pseudomonadota bacterium]
MTHRIGADIGGTFTDLVMVDDGGAGFFVEKVLTTPTAPDAAVVKGVDALLTRNEVAAESVAHLVHGTTLFTNALIERKGAKTALVTTRGFRDAVEIAREHRFDMYDLWMERPTPIAPRHLRFEVKERILADGTVHEPLDETSVEALVPILREMGVEAVAVCLIHAYRNDHHERRVGEILRAGLPGIALSLSCEVNPEIREYDRASTTLCNVYVKGIAEAYLGRLENGLQKRELTGALYVMQSQGGVCDVATASDYPVRLIESGPAAGALAAAAYGNLIGAKDLLSFDMGGTTAKACLILDGEPLIAPEFEADRKYRFKKGSGLPVKVPVIEMIEIGAGGGSLVRLDAMGRLQVGPESAGAEPGPASYGRGGEKPTVTDADLVLGYLDPNFFLGGTMTLDREAARAAIGRTVATPLKLDVVEAAHGIHRLVNENMASAARIHAVERGADSSRLPLFAFGGAGPVHAYGVARILGAPQIVFPLGAGVMSAAGLLSAPLSFDFVRTMPAGLESMDWDAVNGALEKMEDDGRRVLARSIDPSEIRFRRSADARYRRQGHELRVAVPDGPLGPEHAGAIQRAFEEIYRSIYGQTPQDVALDVISWRVMASGPEPRLALPSGKPQQGDVAAAIKGQREVFLPEAETLAAVPVYDRYKLGTGAQFDGPAIVEERESTVVIAGPASARVDAHANLLVEF